MVQEAISAALQVLVALALALVAWLITLAVLRLRKRTAPSLSRYIGLTAPTPRALIWALLAALVLTPLSIALFFLPALEAFAAGENTVAGAIRARGWSAETIGVIAIVAFIKTSLSEEIFFRGLVAKRLIAWLGFAVGNTLHAALFGAVHLLIFVVPGGPAFDPLIAGAFFLVSGVGGWIMAWLNERVGMGSIAPSWLLHGLSNAAAYPALAFL